MEPESSQEQEIFVTQKDPPTPAREPFVEGTLTAEKGKRPKKASKHTETSATTPQKENSDKPAKRKAEDAPTDEKATTKKHKKSKKD